MPHLERYVRSCPFSLAAPRTSEALGLPNTEKKRIQVVVTKQDPKSYGNLSVPNYLFEHYITCTTCRYPPSKKALRPTRHKRQQNDTTLLAQPFRIAWRSTSSCCLPAAEPVADFFSTRRCKTSAKLLRSNSMGSTRSMVSLINGCFTCSSWV